MPTWSINNLVRTPLLLMASVEALIVFSSLYVAGIVAFGSIEACEQNLGQLAPLAMTMSFVVVSSMIAMGLYQFHQRLYFSESIVRTTVGVFAGCLAFACILYVWPAATLTWQVAAISVAYSLALLLLVRYFFVRTVDENAFRRRTLIYGAGDRSQSISELRRRADRRGFKVVAKFAAPGDVVTDGQNVLYTNGKSIAKIAVEYQADEIVVAMEDRRGNLPVRELLDARFKGIDVIDLLEFLERETGKIRVDLIKPGWLVFSHGFKISNIRRFSKRAMDIVASAILLAIAAPVMMLVAIAIKIEDGIRAPVFYRQVRVGQHDQNFSMVKFRSMAEDAEADGQAVWAVEDDDRITSVGNLLRKYRIDELPQLINVMWGDMSLVGPRPERPEFVEELKDSIPYYSERHSVKPGITGWAQLLFTYGSTTEEATAKLQYDLYYVKNHSFILDLMIMLQTVEVVLWGKGAR